MKTGTHWIYGFCSEGDKPEVRSWLANSILDDEGVLRLLLGAPDAAQLARDRGPSVALETTVAGDALAPAKVVA